VTVAMVPVQGKGFKMALQLRSLALVNSAFSQVGFCDRNDCERGLTLHVQSTSRIRSYAAVSYRPLKRRIGYMKGKADENEMQS
jgi:hypothetical protein